MVQAIDNWMVEKFKEYFSNDSSIYYYMYEFWENGHDQRTKDYFMVDMSSLSAILVQVLYLLTIFVFIPWIMSGRPPLQIKKIVLGYNFLMVFINAYFFFKVLFKTTQFGGDLWDFSNPKNDVSEKAMDFIDTAHLYYLSKMLDFLSLIFMSLEKKNDHITFMNVWPRVKMVFAGWMFMRYNPYMPTCALIPIVNGFTNILMYSYYALHSLGPDYQRYLWWKKFLGKSQLYEIFILLAWYIFIYNKHEGMPLGYIYCNLEIQFVLLVIIFYNYFQSHPHKDLIIRSLRQSILAVVNSCHPELNNISRENGYGSDESSDHDHQD